MSNLSTDSTKTINKWPDWPVSSPHLINNLRQVVDSKCWSATNTHDGNSAEQQFAEQFAFYNQARYCVPTVNGTTALRLILQALNIGYGDEVIIPGLTWVSCATAVTDVGAVPIFADVELDTACIAPDQIDNLVTSRTAAVMAVHLFCNIADVESLQAKCEKYNLALIEDCAQSHGSEWGGSKVGTFGRAGAFSMHQGKPLTCGEGGAVITNDEEIYRKVRQISNNGRPSVGHCTNESAGIMQGTNAVLGEFQATILLDGLENLDKQIIRKEANMELLDSLLVDIPGVNILIPSPLITRRSPYHYLIRFDLDYFKMSIDQIADALEAELGFAFARTYPPLNVHPLYQPQTLTMAQRISEYGRALSHAKSKELPVASKIYDSSLIFKHSILLGAYDGESASMQLISDALIKVQST